MKTSQLTLSSLALALLVSASTAHAQTWETSIIGPGSNGDLARDDAGNIYTAGSLFAADGSKKAVVLGLDQWPDTWAPLDIYSEAGLNYAHNRALAYNPATGGFLFGGNLNNLLPNGTYQFNTLWFVREWNPLTDTIATVDDDQALAAEGLAEHSCADILVTPGGDVYATGGSPWLVRKRGYGESSFRTVDIGGSGAGCDMAFHPDYGVFTVGQFDGNWTVRRSATGEPNSWDTINPFADANWGAGVAYCIYVAHNGDIYVGGSANYLPDNNNHWVVRCSQDGGNTWSNVDNLASGAVYGINEDAGGHILLAGQLYEYQRRRGVSGHWIVRQFQENVPHTTTKKGKTTTTYTDEFVTIDDYQVDANRDSFGGPITVDDSGNIFVSGNGLDANGVRQFVVRKLLVGQ